MESLFERMKNPTAVLYHQPDFVDFIEMHMTYLTTKSKEAGRVFELSKNQFNRANRDFNWLCRMVGIPYELHWLTMRVNGLRSSNEYRQNMDEIYFIDIDTLDRLTLQYMEQRSSA